jgi:glycosyltransferase involved in cell wall biosynthesis
MIPMPELSVILPTYNRLGQLKQVLAALEQQTCPLEQFEVVVVSDGSSDGTNDYLKYLQTPLNLRHLFQENQGVAAARNNAVAAAQGRMLVFIDDDVVPVPTLIEQHLASHREAGNENVIVLGPLLTPSDFDMAPWVRWEQKMLEKQYDNLVAGRWQATARQFYTGNTSLLRRHVLEAGGFDPTFRRAEDVELAYRLQDAGLRFVFNIHAVGHHYAQRSFESWLKIPYDYGRNDVIMTRRKGQAWLLPTVFTEYRGRNLLIRVLTQACLGYPRLQRSAFAFLKQVALLGDALHIEALPRFAYSGIFNVHYYQGVADELGGANQFWQALGQSNRGNK